MSSRNHTVKKTQLNHLNVKITIKITKLRKKTEFTQNEASLKAITNLTENTQQNPLRIRDFSYSEMFNRGAHNPLSAEEKQQKSFGCFSLEHTQAEIEGLKQPQQKIKAANHFLRKQELERNQLSQHLNQSDTVQNDNATLRNTQMIASTSKKVPQSKFFDLNFQYLLN